MPLPLNHFSNSPYRTLMIQFRHITIAVSCLVSALPSSAFLACCCCPSSSSECSTATTIASCCCGTSLDQSPTCHTTASTNNCDPECKCSGRDSVDAIISVEHQSDECDSGFVLLYQRFPRIFDSCKAPYAFIVRPLSHNCRQSILCVWLK